MSGNNIGGAKAAAVRKANGTADAHTARRMHTWRHNAQIGSAVMMQKMCNGIMTSTSSSGPATQLASRIGTLAKELETELRNTRIDPQWLK